LGTAYGDQVDLLGLLALGLPASILVGYAWLARRARRRGLGHSFMGPFEDMWDPAVARTEVVIQAQAEAGTPAPTPSDPRLRS
jgi:hypothetical protein